MADTQEKYVVVRIESKVPYKRIEDLLDCASRGARYWAEGVEALGYESEVKRVLSGGLLTIIDIEDDDKRHTLSVDAIEKGLHILAEDYAGSFADFLDENEDDHTGDLFLQCALLGNEVYG